LPRPAVFVPFFFSLARPLCDLIFEAFHFFEETRNRDLFIEAIRSAIPRFK